eukprot:symbB.v1.2.022796.t1/scaffold2058.1/size90862/5
MSVEYRRKEGHERMKKLRCGVAQVEGFLHIHNYTAKAFCWPCGGQNASFCRIQQAPSPSGIGIQEVGSDSSIKRMVG